MNSIDLRGCPTGLEIAADETSAADPRVFVKNKDDKLSLELLIKGAKCANCLAKIENGVKSIAGIETARLNLSSGRLTTAWQDKNLDARIIVQKIIDLGYGAIPFSSDEAKTAEDNYGRSLLYAMTVAGLATMLVMMFTEPMWYAAKYGEMGIATRTTFQYLAALIAIPAGFYSGLPFFKTAWASLKKGNANMDVPISLAIILTAALSIYATINKQEHVFYDAIVMLEFFLLCGRYLDHSLRQKSRIAATELMSLQAATANLITETEIKSIKIEEINAGDLLEILPGDRIPVDGIIKSGSSNFDLSMLTGETMPVILGAGEKIAAGTLNMTGRIIMTASSRSEDSFLSEIARLIEAGEQSKSFYVRLADKAAKAYVPIVHGAALLTLIGWLLLGKGFEASIWNACAVLIITCPCALGLAVPAVQVVASGRLFKQGVLVKSGDALERLAVIDTIVFDKTGVLTKGVPNLLNRNEIKDIDLANAAMLARGSRHPLSRAIFRAAGTGPIADNIKETIGFGVEGIINGKTAKLGSGKWVGADINVSHETEIWFKLENQEPVRFIFEDSLRKDAKATIEKLKVLNLNIEILSGDREFAVKKAAEALNITNYKFGQTPHDKAQRLENLRASGKKILMVGDGLNDAPSLAKAFVSISPGTAAGASQTASDMVFQSEELNSVYNAIKLGKLSRNRILENFWFSAIYNLVTVPIAIMGMVTPQFAAIAMSVSSILVSLNALRLLSSKV